jgi:hypothetical protein
VSLQLLVQGHLKCVGGKVPACAWQLARLMRCGLVCIETAFAALQDGAQMLLDRLLVKLRGLSPRDAILITRMCGHYLNLTGIAETQHMCGFVNPPLPATRA